MSTETPSTTDPLTELVNAFKAALRPAPTPPSASGSPMALPATFAGEAAECSGFLLQVSLFIRMQPQQFPSDSAKVAFLISLLTGKALQWAKAIWNANNPIIHHSTPYITLQVGLFHSERIRFLVLEHSTVSIILGCPWLQQHRPTLRWDPCDVTGWSERCFEHCLSNIPQPLSVPVMLSSTLVESPEPENPPEIPVEYMAFQDVFSKQAATHLPPHRPWDCAIDLLPEAKLPKGKVYPLSIPEHQAMEEYIEEALKQGFIQPSTSPAASSFFFVGKKDGGLRPCIDYRQLNSQIIRQPYPLPLVPAALEELRGAQVFTKLDLRSAYNLIRIRKGDEWKTAFITPTGHYEYRVMPYGLSISPSVFQTFMNEVFREYLHRFVVVYIDDILIYSRNQAEHRQHVQQVLHKLRQHSLFLKLEKCEFHQSTVQFLGYNISAEGVQMDQGKVNAIQKWPLPNSVKELQRFLGFTNFYRRFIMDYSTITAPLTSLLRGKPKQLIWNPAAHEAFERLKTTFSTAPVLHHPDPEHLFTVEVDASSIGVGAVLSQAVGDSSVLHPCAFFSRKLSPAEQNYDIGNRELLAIKLALEEWRHWLEGATHPFTIITDHKNLQYLREARRLNPRQARWALFLTRFNFTITYRPGSKNVPADALSRQFSPEATSDPETIIPSELIVSPIIWDLDQAIQQATLQEPAPPECPEGKTYVPLSQRQILLGTAHGTPGSGHPGSSRTLSLIQSRYWWPSMHQDTIRYVQSCSVCAKSNSPRQLPTGKLVPLPIPERPWSHLGVDFITDLPESEGNTCVLVVVDRFSKACKLIPLRGLPTAMETAEHLFHQVFRHYGLPEEIVSDRGPQFTSHTNGQTERKIQEIGRYLRAYCHDDQHSWSRFLPWAEYAQNSLRQDTTGLTPFQCVLGYQPPLFPWTEEPSNVPAVDHWFRESERVWDSAHDHLQRAVRRHKSFVDARRRAAPHFQPGDLVWLSTRDLRLRLPCRKLSPRYIGPFRILRQINDVTYQL
ncbi:Transposon Tf2-11 polyprotein [Labeo rohita]|uniref:Gypsy retrotransposon integrase-like protein 1 n=1 Tax=Labeo rohita TaxID=84645 RepID=A0ABQ8LH42_LABRO|nr:Transposon Tf2-11 polyprotein [Labeo rohita]